MSMTRFMLAAMAPRSPPCVAAPADGAGLGVLSVGAGASLSSIAPSSSAVMLAAAAPRALGSPLLRAARRDGDGGC